MEQVLEGDGRFAMRNQGFGTFEGALRGLFAGPPNLQPETLLSRVIAVAVEGLEADAGTLAVPTSEAGPLRYACLGNLPSHLSIRSERCLAGLPRQSAGPILVDDYPVHPNAVPELVRLGVQTVLTYPLRVDGEWVGSLDLMRVTPRPFTTEDVERLTPLAFVAGLLIRDVERLAQLQRIEEDLQLLLEITEGGLRDLPLDTLLDHLVGRIEKGAEAQAAGILLVEGDRLVARASVGLPPEVAGSFATRIGEGFVGEVARTLAPVAIEDLSADASLALIVKTYGIRSMLGVPLTVGTRLVGVAHVDYLFSHRFAHEDVKRIRTMAAQAALAIDHVRLVQAERAMAETRRESFRALLQQERLASVGRLSAGLAHELNNPLGAIALHAEILASFLDTPELAGAPARPHLLEATSVISREVFRCKALIRQLLDFSRRPALRYERVNIEVPIAEALGLAELEVRGARQRIVRHASERPAIVWGDPSMLRLLMLSLVVNALDAAPGGGAVTVATALIAPATVQISVAPVAASTDGTGISLGLTVSQRIAEEHGGQIEVESRDPEQRPRAVVRLPLLIEGERG
ncbi:MAG: GAF domain-containing protein [Candidatus Rokubacteria bacterium]|nr:GAF domain-containing protein [Candidatus Rokubacteria bacterium]